MKTCRFLSRPKKWRSNTGRLSIPHEMILIKTTSQQPFADVLQNRCSKKFSNIHTETLLLESVFNKVAVLMSATLLKRDSSTGAFQGILRNFKEQPEIRTTTTNNNQLQIKDNNQFANYKQQTTTTNLQLPNNYR